MSVQIFGNSSHGKFPKFSLIREDNRTLSIVLDTMAVDYSRKLLDFANPRCIVKSLGVDQSQ